VTLFDFQELLLLNIETGKIWLTKWLEGENAPEEDQEQFGELLTDLIEVMDD
jgi:hypothetical protein